MIKIKILWLSNIVIPEFADAYGIKKNPMGGWISGMYNELNKLDDFEIRLIFPIRDSHRMKKGIFNNCVYYSIFDKRNSKNDLINNIDLLKEILEEYTPDIIHVWGTEYIWSFEMAVACEQLGYLKHLVISIQGLISICEKCYLDGVPKELLKYKDGTGKSLIDYKKDFHDRGMYEIKLLQKALNVMGRTRWDRACTFSINPNLNYFHCGPILRNVFYTEKNKWSYEKCIKNRIFISQATYPIKGFHYFIEALVIIKPIIKDVTVFVAGNNVSENDDVYASYINELIKKNKLDTCIHFTGLLKAEEMIEEYLKSNIFVSTSTVENESNSILEAMKLGVPVISSYVGGIPSYMIDGLNGKMFPSGDINLLAYSIIECLSDENLCSYLSHNAIKTANDYVKKDRILKDIIQAYNEIYTY